mmetsp:Transcript_7023/g.23056  ORF Transcript_7023/g.23056 Transcript_7023/m.23056 type:complete len:333 (+) Transcript_7023:928-1926(+)
MASAAVAGRARLGRGRARDQPGPRQRAEAPRAAPGRVELARRSAHRGRAQRPAHPRCRLLRRAAGARGGCGHPSARNGRRTPSALRPPPPGASDRCRSRQLHPTRGCMLRGGAKRRPALGAGQRGRPGGCACGARGCAGLHAACDDELPASGAPAARARADAGGAGDRRLRGRPRSGQCGAGLRRAAVAGARARIGASRSHPRNDHRAGCLALLAPARLPAPPSQVSGLPGAVRGPRPAAQPGGAGAAAATARRSAAGGPRGGTARSGRFRPAVWPGRASPSAGLVRQGPPRQGATRETRGCARALGAGRAGAVRRAGVAAGGAGSAGPLRQ